MIKLFISFFAWLFGAYIILFASCLYVHVNESNIIANRANALLPKITREDKSGLVKVVTVQNMKRKSKPSFWQPLTLFNSLFGERQTDKSINRVLGRAIESLKDDLKSSNLSRVDLREANLSNGKLEKADLTNADLTRTFLHKADLRGANLTNANLNRAHNVTCEQIQSAVIDKTTRLPDYILLAEPSSSQFSYINMMKGKGIDFKGVNLAETFLYGADLRDANLNHAYLMGATLGYAKFTNADLSNANLTGAKLDRAHNVTCEQIQSAVIDKNTQLPDYIRLIGSPGLTNECKSTLKKN